VANRLAASLVRTRTVQLSNRELVEEYQLMVGDLHLSLLDHLVHQPQNHQQLDSLVVMCTVKDITRARTVHLWKPKLVEKYQLLVGDLHLNLLDHLVHQPQNHQQLDSLVVMCTVKDITNTDLVEEHLQLLLGHLYHMLMYPMHLALEQDKMLVMGMDRPNILLFHQLSSPDLVPEECLHPSLGDEHRILLAK